MVMGRDSNDKVVPNPTTQEMFVETAAKFMRLRKEHQRASALMWQGYLVNYFSDFELSLLPDYLSDHDRALIKAGRDGEKEKS